MIYKKIIPSSLLGRSLIIVFAPILILVVLTTFIFYQTSWSIISKRLAQSVVADINVIVKLIDQNLKPEAIQIAKKDFKMDVIYKKDTDLNKSEDSFEEPKTQKNEKVYINLTALDKITAKTTAIRLGIGEKKFFGPLEIKALKCQLSENKDSIDTVAYLQVKDLSSKDNNQVFLFNGWTFASSPTLQSIDHPVYDLWITSCENI